MRRRSYKRNHMAEISRAKGILAYGEKISHLLSSEMNGLLTLSKINIAKAEVTVREMQAARRGTVTLSDMDHVFDALDVVQRVYLEMKHQADDIQAALQGIENT